MSWLDCTNFDQNHAVFKFLQSQKCQFIDVDGDKCFNSGDKWVRNNKNWDILEFVFQEGENVTSFLKKVLDGLYYEERYTYEGAQVTSKREIIHVDVAQDKNGIFIGFERKIEPGDRTPLLSNQLYWLLPNGNVKKFQLRDFTVIPPKPGTVEDQVFTQTQALVGVIRDKFSSEENFMNATLIYLNLKGEPVEINSNQGSHENSTLTLVK